jgi:hypothetical protein
MDPSPEDPRPARSTKGLRLLFYACTTGLVASFFANVTLPRWYHNVRFGHGGLHWSRLMWSRILDHLYQLDGPQPRPVYWFVLWISLAGLVLTCAALRRTEPSLARIGCTIALVLLVLTIL